MTTTAPPVERQNNWIVTKDKDGNIIQAATVLGNSRLIIVYKNWETWCMISRAFGVSATLKTATTPEEAITEAVVTIAQHLAQLSAELGAIPITLPK